MARMFEVNVTDAMLGIQAVIPVMQAASGGSIVNICSVLALVGGRNSVAYAASKWALRGLTKSVALELGASGIRVNAVHPGYVDTPMLADVAAPATGVLPLPAAAATRHGRRGGRAGVVPALVRQHIPDRRRLPRGWRDAGRGRTSAELPESALTAGAAAHRSRRSSSGANTLVSSVSSPPSAREVSPSQVTEDHGGPIVSARPSRCRLRTGRESACRRDRSPAHARRSADSPRCRVRRFSWGWRNTAGVQRPEGAVRVALVAGSPITGRGRSRLGESPG